jgi:hypothetical protein
LAEAGGKIKKPHNNNSYKALLYGAGERIRTADRLITNQLLYQLSYTSIFREPKLALSYYLNKK